MKLINISFLWQHYRHFESHDILQTGKRSGKSRCHGGEIVEYAKKKAITTSSYTNRQRDVALMADGVIAEKLYFHENRFFIYGFGSVFGWYITLVPVLLGLCGWGVFRWPISRRQLGMFSEFLQQWLVQHLPCNDVFLASTGTEELGDRYFYCQRRLLTAGVKGWEIEP